MLEIEATRFPLSWPANWKRTPYHQRRRAAFHSTREVARADGIAGTYRRKETLSVGDGLERLSGELRRLGASRIVVSSNLQDSAATALPYSKQAKVLDDPGVAVYFRLENAPRVLACDKWQSAAENLAAIAGHISAMRMQERYGVGTLSQAFAGYAALPPAAVDWPIVLGVSAAASRDEILEAYRRLARVHHPDAGGELEAMAKINTARDHALAALEAAGR